MKVFLIARDICSPATICIREFSTINWPSSGLHVRVGLPHTTLILLNFRRDSAKSATTQTWCHTTVYFSARNTCADPQTEPVWHPTTKNLGCRLPPHSRLHQGKGFGITYPLLTHLASFKTPNTVARRINTRTSYEAITHLFRAARRDPLHNNTVCPTCGTPNLSIPWLPWPLNEPVRPSGTTNPKSQSFYCEELRQGPPRQSRGTATLVPHLSLPTPRRVALFDPFCEQRINADAQMQHNKTERHPQKVVVPLFHTRSKTDTPATYFLAYRI